MGPWTEKTFGVITGMVNSDKGQRAAQVLRIVLKAKNDYAGDYVETPLRNDYRLKEVYPAAEVDQPPNLPRKRLLPGKHSLNLAHDRF